VRATRWPVASTVHDALDIIANREVRSVILDHQMGDDDGGSFLDRGRDLPPVIVMSGAHREVLDRIRLEHGSQLFACLAKPVPIAELLETVRAAVEHG
jgi:DNA-binding response OmpR family regulator